MIDTSTKLPSNIRLLIAIVTIPAQFALFLTALALYLGEWSFSVQSIFFNIFTVVAIYVVLTGKMPKIIANIFEN